MNKHTEIQIEREDLIAFLAERGIVVPADSRIVTREYDNGDDYISFPIRVCWEELEIVNLKKTFDSPLATDSKLPTRTDRMVAVYLQDSNRIDAIRLIRGTMNCCLKDAKGWLDANYPPIQPKG